MQLKHETLLQYYQMLGQLELVFTKGIVVCRGI